MKKWIAMLLAVVMCFALAACGSSSSTQESTPPAAETNQPADETPAPTQSDAGSSENTEAPVESESPAQPEPEPEEPGIELSSDLADFTVSIDGTVYQFPCSVQTFLDDGWQPATMSWLLDEDNVVEGGATANADVYRTSDSETIFLMVYNPGKSACHYRDCTVFGVQLSASKNVSVTFSRGLTLGTEITVEDMLKLDESLREDATGIVVYGTGGNKYTFKVKDGILSYCEVEMKH